MPIRIVFLSTQAQDLLLCFYILRKQPTKIEKTGDAIKDKVENAASSLDYASNTMVIKNENRQLQP
jgi:hypothetical protein